MKSELISLQAEVDEIKKTQSQIYVTMLLGELAVKVERAIIECVFNNIPDVDFVTINKLHAILACQCGPGIPHLSYQQITSLQKNLKDIEKLFKPHQAHRLYGVVQEFKEPEIVWTTQLWI